MTEAGAPPGDGSAPVLRSRGPEGGAGSRPAGARPSGARLAARLVARNLTRATVLAGEVESADGLWAKFRGLMGRSSLAAGAGLWLPDSNGIHMMFMRFPIDAVFLGRPDAAGARAVVSVHRRLPAWRGLVPLVRGAHGVLELPIGTIDASGTAVGDLVALEPAGAP